MSDRLKARYVEEAQKAGLLIAEFEGSSHGIGTRDELEELRSDGILPEGTTFRPARADDF